MTILLKTASDSGGRLRSRSPWHRLPKGKLIDLFKLLNVGTATRAQLPRKLARNPSCLFFLTKNSQEPRNLVKHQVVIEFGHALLR